MYADTPRSRSMVARLEERYPNASANVVLAPRNVIQPLWAKCLEPALMRFACDALADKQPQMSARRTLTVSQFAFIALLLTCAFVWVTANASSFFSTVAILFGGLYFMLSILRLFACVRSSPAPDGPNTRIADSDLPPYSVLVAVYDEAVVVPQLVRELLALDYPADLLDIQILTEECDVETRAALKQCTLPDHIAVITVPNGHPRTKPKALNFDLPLTRGRFVAVFDAEDRPDPDQLRRAVAAYRAYDARKVSRPSMRPLGCLQAALHVTNKRDGFLARHFQLEYVALFDALLPVLSNLGLPLPLGGTSNHFFGIR